MRAGLVIPATVLAVAAVLLADAQSASAGDLGGQNNYSSAQASGGTLTVQAGHAYWTPPATSSWATPAKSDPPPGTPNPNQPYDI